MKKLKLIATDLDRTLLPNGVDPYDDSMPLFEKIVAENNFILAFVSGRHKELVLDAMREYQTPEPDYIIGDVGTTLWLREEDDFKRDESWDRTIKSKTKNWDIESFKKKIGETDGLKIQEKEKQNIFKLSYYIHNVILSKKIVEYVKDVVLNTCECKDANIVYSIDEVKNIGFLDVLPKSATKEGALEYLRKKLSIDMDEVLYSGDSGNDILPLTFGYNAVVVRNAIDEVRNQVLEIAKEKNIEDKIYFAKGSKAFNGYYVSGIIEALVSGGFIKEPKNL